MGSAEFKRYYVLSGERYYHVLFTKAEKFNELNRWIGDVGVQAQACDHKHDIVESIPIGRKEIFNFHALERGKMRR